MRVPVKRGNYHALKTWEDVRRVVLGTTGGTCASCGTDKGPIHVHHTYYEPARERWDYPLTSFEALCPPCHAQADQERRLLMYEIGQINSCNRLRVVGYMQGLRVDWEDGPPSTLEVLSAEYADGLADVFATTDRAVFEAARPDYRISADTLRAISTRRQHRNRG